MRGLKLGPYQLGDSVSVSCVVLGGQPSPGVTWWRDHQIVDDSEEQVAPGRVTNILTIPALHRSDLHSILTCQARSSKESVPVSTSVKLDMTFQPETVRIAGLGEPMAAGQAYHTQCVAVGARPAPAISWWVGETRLDTSQATIEVSYYIEQGHYL